MTTWVGAIVETKGHTDFAALAAKHRIVLTGPVAPTVFVQVDVNFGSRRPFAFAESLSRDLQGTVIAFLVETTASVERIEHWDKGQLVRKLEYSGDQGGWIVATGTPQAWEPAYFFADGQGTADASNWPPAMEDELTGEDLARFERAKAAKDASDILDLVSGGETWALRRVCRRFGVDPDKPTARYTPSRNWRPKIIVGATIVFFVSLVLWGVLNVH